MGFSSLATYVIMFAVGMSILIGLLFSYKVYFVKSAESLQASQEINKAKLASALEILNATYNVSEYAETSLIIDSQADFELGIFDNTTSTEEVGWLRLDLDNLTGDWYSEIYELNYSMNYTNITIAGADPGAQTQVKAQIRTASTTAGLTGEFLGPDGTSATFYELPDIDSDTFILNETHDGDSVIQIKISLQRDLTTLEPRVDSITIGTKASYILNVNIKNTGSIRIDKDLLDIFLSSDRISRDRVVSAAITDATDIVNPGLWDPDEILNLNISYPIDNGNYRLSIANEYGTQNAKIITI